LKKIVYCVPRDRIAICCSQCISLVFQLMKEAFDFVGWQGASKFGRCIGQCNRIAHDQDAIGRERPRKMTWSSSKPIDHQTSSRATNLCLVCTGNPTPTIGGSMTDRTDPSTPRGYLGEQSSPESLARGSLQIGLILLACMKFGQSVGSARRVRSSGLRMQLSLL